MAHAHLNLSANSPVFRLENPDTLDVRAIEAAAAKPQRGAWRHLADVFKQAARQHCNQFCIEPDATLWRIRYRTIDGYDESILSDPSQMIWALNALQSQLWGEDFHTLTHRTARFCWVSEPFNLAVTLRVVHTVNGDMLQFKTEPMTPMPPLLDELALPAEQLGKLRARLAQRRGMLLVTSAEPHLLDDTLLALNQALISPDLNLLSISNRHRYSLPRTTQIELANLTDKQLTDTWKHAMDSFHNAILINACVPDQFHEQLANTCDQGVMAILAMPVANAADTMQLLNARVIRRAPLHRAVTTVINHFLVESLCEHCAGRATLNAEEQQWLEQSRTPVTENVISWLADGNTEHFMSANGCDKCHGTGKRAPLSVYDIIYRDDKTHQFPTGAAAASPERPKALQRQLMSLAKAGTISLSEVMRVLKLAG